MITALILQITQLIDQGNYIFNNIDIIKKYFLFFYPVFFIIYKYDLLHIENVMLIIILLILFSYNFNRYFKTELLIRIKYRYKLISLLTFNIIIFYYYEIWKYNYIKHIICLLISLIIIPELIILLIINIYIDSLYDLLFNIIEITKIK